MALAAGFGITVGVCRLSNPDFQLPSTAVPSRGNVLERWRYGRRQRKGNVAPARRDVLATFACGNGNPRQILRMAVTPFEKG